MSYYSERSKFRTPFLVAKYDSISETAENAQHEPPAYIIFSLKTVSLYISSADPYFLPNLALNF